MCASRVKGDTQQMTGMMTRPRKWSIERRIPARDPKDEKKEEMMVQLKRIVGTLVVLAAFLTGVPAMAAGDKAVVNINTADTDDLMLLPRIGPSVAQRIVEFREKNGRFKIAEDLMLVRGVGEKTFELIKPHVAISGETTLVEKVQVPKEQSGDS